MSVLVVTEIMLTLIKAGTIARMLVLVVVFVVVAADTFVIAATRVVAETVVTTVR